MRQIPKRLDISRSCYYIPIPNATERELMQRELEYRSKFKNEFVQRIGSRFFFQFRSAKMRDDFLMLTEGLEHFLGNICVREMITN